MLCSRCFFFRGDDGRCANPRSRFGYVGFFQEAGPCFADRETPEPVKENKTMAEESKEIKRKCADCGRELPLEQFARNRSGYTKYCKECMKVRRGKGKQPGGNYHLPQAPLNVGIAAIGDEALMAELKKRGWSGRLTKTLEMEI